MACWEAPRWWRSKRVLGASALLGLLLESPRQRPLWGGLGWRGRCLAASPSAVTAATARMPSAAARSRVCFRLGVASAKRLARSSVRYPEVRVGR
jgi:hypothetical protein